MHLWLSESSSTIKITASMIFIFFAGDSNGNKRLQNECRHKDKKLIIQRSISVPL